VLAGVFSLLAVVLVGLLVIFLLDVPLALRAPDAGVLLEIKKTVVRTLVMGAAFEALFLGSAVVSFRYVFRRVKDA
jgi:hypothetical protein